MWTDWGIVYNVHAVTTLVALSTKDALVMGCDSLASVTQALVDPYALVEFFDGNNAWCLKLGADNKPILTDWYKVYEKAQVIPYSHMTHMSKLFSLSPLPMAVMTSGITSIGQRTIKSLIAEFKARPSFINAANGSFTVKSIGSRLLRLLWKHYCIQYPKDSPSKPILELILGGYDSDSPISSIYRIRVNENKIEATIDDFGMVFGGEMEEIQRIVFGTDYANQLNITARSFVLLEKYHNLLGQHLKNEKIEATLPPPSQYVNELGMFSDGWNLIGFKANWGDFSEQNAIECVDFFINIMIKSQQFSSRMPTVGGEAHIALITKERGFRFVSREELSHAGHSIAIEEE
jgi:hypothetical protein